MNTWFTSDHHFGHRNILRYCQRPFADVESMNEALIGRWNARVGDDDAVYHLGDFTLAGRGLARAMFARLRGRIYVLGLPWHHDRGWVPRTPGPSDYVGASGVPVEILPPLVVLRIPARDGGGRRLPVTLSHYPMAEWEAAHHGGWHLHGHSHGNHRGPNKKLDVGVDCHDFAPIHLDEVGTILDGVEVLGHGRQAPTVG